MNDSMFQDRQVVESNRILYTASSFARANLIHLQEIGESRSIRAHTGKRDGLNSFLFFLVLEGAGTVGCGSKEKGEDETIYLSETGRLCLYRLPKALFPEPGFRCSVAPEMGPFLWLQHERYL